MNISTPINKQWMLCWLFIFTLFFMGSALAHKEKSDDAPKWKQINIPSHMTIKDDDGDKKDIFPGCAFGYDPQNPSQALDDEHAFHFYFQKGKKDKLVFFFNGGGACWNDHTCITSLKAGDRPTYNPSLLTENTPDSSGILSATREDNPFKDWSKVFIPYCTGDIHIGSKNSVYTDLLGLVTGTPGAQVMVQHRGFDNFLAVRDWVKNKVKAKKVKSLIVSGSSAGGYGATLNFPYLQEAFPKADATLISDGSAAIVTQGFLDTVFSTDSPWGVENTISQEINEFDQLDNFQAETFNETLLTGLANSDKKVKIAQYTTAWDAVQVQFLNIMKNPNNPTQWANIPAATFCEWNARMVESFSLTASANNYRHYIGQGMVHTALTDAFMPEIYYTEASGGILFTEWLEDLTDDDHHSNWDNQACTDCGAPFDPQLCAML